jgi:hypothetical protein
VIQVRVDGSAAPRGQTPVEAVPEHVEVASGPPTVDRPKEAAAAAAVAPALEGAEPAEAPGPASAAD